MSFSFARFPITPLRLYRLTCLVLMAGMLLMVWLMPVPGSFHARLQGMVYDSLLPRRAPVEDSRVVIVDIDEASLAALGRWPWSRTTMAELVARVRAAGAAVVGVDVLFPEPEDTVGDVALAAQLEQEDVVAAVAFGFTAAALLDSADASAPKEPTSLWPTAASKVGLSPALSAAARGHITPLHDPDHVIRRLYPVICLDECRITLALAMLQSWAGIPWHFDKGSVWQPDRVCVGAFCLTLNPDRTLSIPYQQPSRFASVSAAEVLQQEPPALLQGAMVLIGTSAVGLGDLVATPLSATTPGVMIHAMLLTAAMDSVTWAELPGASWWLSLMVVSMLVLVWWCPVRGRWWWLATLVWGAMGLLATLWLPQLGYWVQPLPLWGALAGGTLLLGIWQGAELLRQRRRIYRAFAAYVPHEVIKTLVRNNLRPEQLDAQRVDVTVMFADIHGFTSLSERLEPEQLVDLTNQLFTAINEEIHRHRGTLDKFMGDAVMAFWGAPLPQQDHAEQALHCAEAIQKRLHGMADWLSEQGYPDITMSIALESGPVAVGNFGSRQRRAYTVMGKTVNLAAHLQPMCSAYGVKILCGPGLCKRLPENIRYLEPVIIRGIEGKQVIGTPL